MANRTDPLMNSLSGNDPQNYMEYITRQKIYDCRYWKEECFGLTIENVLEKSVQQLQCIGTLPYTKFLCLLLKLLQLNVEHDIIYSTFIQQETQQRFKYTKALGAIYIRLTSRPVEIYESLEPLYNDYSKLRVYDNNNSNSNNNNPFRIITMDEFVHQLLTNVLVLGITLPRLPIRKTLQDAGYLPDGIRPTGLLPNIISLKKKGYYKTYTNNNKNDDNNNSNVHDSNDDDDDSDNETTTNDFYDSVLNYLKHKALVEKCPAAIIAWGKRQQQLQSPNEQESYKNNEDSKNDKNTKPLTNNNIPTDKSANEIHNNNNHKHDLESGEEEEEEEHDQLVYQKYSNEKNEEKKNKKRKKKKDKERNYDNLFKQRKKDDNNNTVSRNYNSKPASEELLTTTTVTVQEPELNDQQQREISQEGSEEYWNEQRAKLGLKPLR